MFPTTHSCLCTNMHILFSEQLDFLSQFWGIYSPPSHIALSSHTVISMAHSNRVKICTWRAFDTPLSSLQLDIEQLACTHSAGNRNKLFAPEHLLITLYCCSIEVFSVCLKCCFPPPSFPYWNLLERVVWIYLTQFSLMNCVQLSKRGPVMFFICGCSY